MKTHHSALDACLNAVWRRTQQRHFSAGLLAWFIWGIPIFLIGVAVDRFAFLPPSGRWVVLLVLVAVSFYQAWRHGWRHLRRFEPKRSALQIEDHEGGLESLLVTAVQFSHSGASRGTSQSLWEATRHKAEEAAKSLLPRKIVTFDGLKRPVRVALLLAFGIGIFAVANGPFLAAGVARIFAPWLAVSYPTKTRIHLAERNLVVKEGEAAQIHASLSGVVPDTAKLELMTGEGRPREIELEVQAGVATYAIAAAARDFSYRIKAGDARTDWHFVQVVPAPRIDDVKVVLEFPAYLEKPSETMEALTLTVPEETRVKWHLTLDQPIRKAVLNRDGQEPLELEVSEDGRQLVVDELVQASRGYSFSWVEKKYGFDFNSPRYYLQVAADQPPRVELVSPDANVVAMLGRQLDLVVRAQDDHGIGAATITHRVNLRPEKTVPVTQPLRNGEGEQKIEWDYREALTDLKVGDTVSFVVEVGDRYPAPQGPHLARTETRRITFLSREDYLAQIEKKKDRLLSRVRTIYRQERAAHELVRNLNAGDESFTQTCQLEAIRQEMLREQLNETAGEVQALLDDLAANNISDVVESESLQRVCAGLGTIAQEKVAKAAARLREHAGANHKDAGTSGLAAADDMVNQAARELGSLVLQRGIDSAREVFAMETHMLAQEQATLRLRAIEMESAPSAAALEDLAKHQEDLAAWTDRLLKDLEQGMRYDKRPIAILGLTRRMKELRSAGVEASMKEAAAMIRRREFKPAAVRQLATIKPLLEAEYSVRTGAEYAGMMETKELLESLRDQQGKLRAECETMAPGQFGLNRPAITTRQQTLRKNLLLVLLPSIPAPRPHLFDESPPKEPPADALRAAAEQSMGAALAEMNVGEKEAVVARQRETEKSLAELTEIVGVWSADLALLTQGLTSLVSTATNRVSFIEDYETRQIGLLEQAEEAGLDKKPAKPLAESQKFLAEEISGFSKELLAQNETKPDKDVQPIVNRLESAASAMTQAAVSLENNQPEDALEPQELASAALAGAKELITAQCARLTLLQGLYAFQRAVGQADETMVDVVAEQHDLIKATKAAKEGALSALKPAMRNLRQCLIDVAPVLGLVAGRLDAGSPLLFAGSDMDDALAALEDGDQEDATDAQEVAADSLAKVRILVHAVKEQTSYLAEIVEYLHGSLADAALMQFRQQQIREKVAPAPGAVPAALVKEQEELLAEADAYGHGLERATGMSAYATAAKLMSEAMRFMRAGDATAAAGQMKLAEAALKENAEQLFIVISMLHGLPSITVTSASPAELVVLLDALALASDQRHIYRQAQATAADGLAALASPQLKLEPRYMKLIEKSLQHAKLVTAQQQASMAAVALPSSLRDEAIRSLRAADEALRHFVIEQAIVLDTAIKPGSSSDQPVASEAETDDLSVSLANMVSDFVSGEAPKDKRTEWEVLGNRNRAALNQNFARELPLEYRGILKDYYERVAK
jgi:hypothetical protein